MQLRLSLNEVINKSTQALRGLNLPSGSDVENGKNIGWLECRGLPGLQILVQEIQTSLKRASHLPSKINIAGDTVHFSNSDQSAFYLAQSAVDLAENGKTVKIMKCKYPLLLFAEMARRKHLPFGFKIKWIGGGKINTCFSYAGNTTSEFQSRELQVACCLELIAIKNLNFFTSKNVIDLQEAVLKSGISCDPYKWEVVCTIANKMLVPDSKQSHTSAGAEVDDNL
tara:strand:- start:1334 stop:2011 length:678 start_codon:yes stop_codon:yes gene_type:complete